MHQEFEPPAKLHHAIKCFWHHTRDAVKDGVEFEVMPDGYAEIIFYLGNGFGVTYKDEVKLLSSPFLVGLLNQPVNFYSPGASTIIGVRCYPWAVFGLLGIQPSNSRVDTLQHPIAALQEPLSQIVTAGDIASAIDLVQQFFLGNSNYLDKNNSLTKAGKALRNAMGSIAVSAVAAEAHATVRTLERAFKQSSGHTVKNVTALMRFEQVRNRLWIEPKTNLAALAHESGYTDQSHMSREFKKFSGTTPAAFAREARSGKVVVIENFVAFVQD
ncbi:helix-turn-helix domain-containing protein [Mucilaginibacter ginkgonis]|uniref:AraC family transcriptional regulator n=1 Tax=Mucilaginibacter ginkgonis TaxID=2682091 RepID=A0A6I4I1F8_9SPHI|nr:helix-turn-helix domain-containing protein [Mucilaginibacter ginkgonis]QQL48967.1 AraC family transcriptional regulator [Mucilaginibacter ginkgonis]